STYLSPIPTHPISGFTVANLTTTDGTNTKTQFKPRDTINYVATLGSTSGSSGTGQLTFTVIDPRGQTMLTSVSSVDLPVFDDIIASVVPSNALNGQYTVTATLTYQGQTTAKRVSFAVAG